MSVQLAAGIRRLLCHAHTATATNGRAPQPCSQARPQPWLGATRVARKSAGGGGGLRSPPAPGVNDTSAGA